MKDKIGRMRSDIQTRYGVLRYVLEQRRMGIAGGYAGLSARVARLGGPAINGITN